MDGTVGTADLAIGAVTDDKITGPISASKINWQKYDRVAVVAQSGGDYGDPASALESIALASWCGIPSSSNPCLLKIMPGLYTLPYQQIVIPAFVDVEGSGEGTTTITGVSAPFIIMNSSGLRSLTVEVSACPVCTCLALDNGSTKLTDFTLKCSGFTGVNSLGSEITMRNVTISLDAVTGGCGLQIENPVAADLDNVKIYGGNPSNNAVGISAMSGSTAANVVFRNGKVIGGWGGIRTVGMTIKNSEIRAAGYGVSAPATTIIGSTISGSYASLYAVDGGTKVSFSELVGPIGSGSGMSCFNVHNEIYTTVACP